MKADLLLLLKDQRRSGMVAQIKAAQTDAKKAAKA